MPTRPYLNASLDRAANATIDTFSYYYNTARMSGDGDQYYEFLQSLASRESVLRSALELRTKSVSNCYVSIWPGRGTDKNLAMDNAVAFAPVWDDLDTFDYFRHTAGGLPTFGLSASEIEWSDNKPVAIWTVDNRALGWVPHTGLFLGRSAGLAPNTIMLKTGPWQWQPLRPGQWLVSQNSSHGTPADWPVIKACVPDTLFLINSTKNWAGFVDKFGIPILQAIVASNADEKTIAAVRELLAQIQAGDKALVNKDKDKVEIKTIDGANVARVGSSDVQSRFIDVLERHIDRIVTGGTLNQNSGSTGSYALGNVHADNASTIYAHDLSNIENTLNHQLVKPWYQRNDMSGPRPEIKLYTQRELSNILSKYGYISGQGQNIVASDLDELGRMMGVQLRAPEPEQENSDG